MAARMATIAVTIMTSSMVKPAARRRDAAKDGRTSRRFMAEFPLLTQGMISPRQGTGKTARYEAWLAEQTVSQHPAPPAFAAPRAPRPPPIIGAKWRTCVDRAVRTGARWRQRPGLGRTPLSLGPGPRRRPRAKAMDAFLHARDNL